MRDELEVTDKERHSHFHGNDDLISVEEMWQSWVQSEGKNHVMSEKQLFPLLNTLNNNIKLLLYWLVGMLFFISRLLLILHSHSDALFMSSWLEQSSHF